MINFNNTQFLIVRKIRVNKIFQKIFNNSLNKNKEHILKYLLNHNLKVI